MSRDSGDVARKRADFWIGFASWLVLNGIVGGLVWALWAFSIPSGAGAVARLNVTLPVTVLIVVNLFALVVFALTRHFVAIGMLAAPAVAIVGFGIFYGSMVAAVELIFSRLSVFGLLLVPLGLVAACFAVAFALQAVLRRIR